MNFQKCYFTNVNLFKFSYFEPNLIENSIGKVVPIPLVKSVKIHIIFQKSVDNFEIALKTCLSYGCGFWASKVSNVEKYVDRYEQHDLQQQ